ncbi:MAG: polysaccharide ABC transporter ATP-binding protein [Bacteroidota bacterium]
MGERAIKVEGLTKRYTIGNQKSGSFRESFSALLRKRAKPIDFFALKDVSFSVDKGDAIGIVGRNGAGKSTLLKVLSRITEPSSGRIEINGRVASLLEVGTGFHPELTGRENIFLNGTILGMTRREVSSQFDAIVDFSGVEKFIDTPVKHYSSGMYVRLAFAVAAHLDPEILIIDEVLAVGDADFQKKCLGKMEEVSKNYGRTVLFVSHNMTAVSSLCNKGIMLKSGMVSEIGTAADVVHKYLNNEDEGLTYYKNWQADDEIHHDGVVQMHYVKLVGSDGEDISVAKISESIGIELSYSVKKDGYKPIPNIHLFTEKGEKVFVSVSPSKMEYTKAGTYKSRAWIPPNFLNQENYIVGIAVSTLSPVVVHASDYRCIYFEVMDDLLSVTRNGFTGRIDGVIRPLLDWELIDCN